MKKYKYLLGVDPDIEKSGLSVLSLSTKRIDLYSLPFPKLLEFLKDSQVILPGLCVYVEAGWLESNSNHHGVTGRRGQKIAKNVGSNHQTGRHIVEMCKHYGIDVEEVRPLKKSWKGPHGKITQEEIEYFIPGFPSRSNQETRDAALICWYHAGLPIRVKVQTIKPQQK